MTTSTQTLKPAEAIKSGAEAELTEALAEIAARFSFLENQLEGKLRQLREDGRLQAVENNPSLMDSQKIIADWNDLHAKCEKEAATEDGNPRRHLLVDGEVPCLTWLDELRGHFEEVKQLH